MYSLMSSKIRATGKRLLIYTTFVKFLSFMNSDELQDCISHRNFFISDYPSLKWQWDGCKSEFKIYLGSNRGEREDSIFRMLWLSLKSPIWSSSTNGIGDIRRNKKISDFNNKSVKKEQDLPQGIHWEWDSGSPTRQTGAVLLTSALELSTLKQEEADGSRKVIGREWLKAWNASEERRVENWNKKWFTDVPPAEGFRKFPGC